MPLIGAARCPAGTKHAYGDGAQAILDEIAVRLAPEDPQSARAKALGLYTLAVGTLQVSRVVSDPKVADEVLDRASRTPACSLAENCRSPGRRP